MGQGMVNCLLERGFTVQVWNRHPDATQPLVDRGATKADSVAELVQYCDVVLTMIRDDAAVRSVLLGDEGAFSHATPGKTFIDTSTVTPDMARELADTAAKKGLYYLESPVAGSKEAAATRQLTLLVGGPADVLEQQRDVLEAIGSRIVHVGDYGTASTMKLAVNQAMGVAAVAVREALALTATVGIDRQLAVDLVMGGITRMATGKTDAIKTQNWEPQFMLSLMHKDLIQALETAQKEHVHMPLLTAVQQVYKQAEDAGKGRLDFSVITGE